MTACKGVLMFRGYIYEKKQPLKPDKWKQVWVYRYPAFDGEVCNRAIARAQAGITNLSRKKGHCYYDFRRDYTLNGRSHRQPLNSTKKEAEIMAGVEADIHALVYSCTGYGSDDRTFQLLEEWMQSRSGQDNGFFIQELVRDNHFLDKSHNCIAALNQSSRKSDWSINKDNKLEFQYAADIFSINARQPGKLDSEVAIIANDLKKIETCPINDARIQEIEKHGMPLLRIEARMQLEIRNDRVIPVFKSIIVRGYTGDLRIHRENIINNHDGRNRIALQILLNIRHAMSEYRHNDSVIHALGKLIQMIEGSGFGDNIQIIREACAYIENRSCLMHHLLNDCYVSMSYLFMKNTGFVDSYINKLNSKPSIIPNPMYQDDTAPIFHHKNEDLDAIVGLFGRIYIELKQFLLLFNPVAAYDYIADETGCIEAAFISEWQENLLKADAADKAAYNDFRNGFNIDGFHFTASSSDHEIDLALRHLVMQVKDRTYADKKALAAWIGSRGGRINDIFLQYMFIFREFSLYFPEEERDPNTDITLMPETIRRVRADWDLDMDGNACLSCAFHINSLDCCYSGKTPDEMDDRRIDKIAVRNYPENKLVFEPKARQPEGHGKFPVLRIEASICLAVENGIVTPRMKSLHVEIYTGDLMLARVEHDHYYDRSRRAFISEHVQLAALKPFIML